MQDRGIQHIRICSEAHAQNGRVEQLHVTLLIGVKTCLAESGSPQQWWAEANRYTAYTQKSMSLRS